MFCLFFGVVVLGVVVIMGVVNFRNKKNISVEVENELLVLLLVNLIRNL